MNNPFGYVDETKPHTIITLNQAAVIRTLRRARLAAGVYKMQGDVRGRFSGHVRERRMVERGVFSVEFVDGKTVSAQTQSAPPELQVETPPVTETPPVPEQIPQEQVTEDNAAGFTDAEGTKALEPQDPPEITTENSEALDPAKTVDPVVREVKKLRANSKCSKLHDLLADGYDVISKGVTFTVVQPPVKEGDQPIDHAAFYLDGVSYLKTMSDLSVLDCSVASLVEANESENRNESLEATPSEESTDEAAGEPDEAVQDAEENVDEESTAAESVDGGTVPEPEEDVESADSDDFTPRDRTRS